MKTICLVLALSAASVSFGNVLVNGEFDNLPILHDGQTDVEPDKSKMIVPALDLVVDPNEYYNGISGIEGWIAGSYDGKGVSDHGISRLTYWGDQDDPRMLHINNWNRRVSQTTSLAVELGYTYTATVRMYMKLDNVDANKAGLFQLIAGGMDSTDPDQLADGSLVLDSLTVASQHWSDPKDYTLADQQYVDLTLTYTPTAGDAALGKYLTFAMRTEWGSEGPTFWDHASLSAQAVPEPASLLFIGAGALALYRRRRK